MNDIWEAVLIGAVAGGLQLAGFYLFEVIQRGPIAGMRKSVDGLGRTQRTLVREITALTREVKGYTDSHLARIKEDTAILVDRQARERETVQRSEPE